MDFTEYVTKPIIPFDAELANTSHAFPFHRNVLQKISPYFATKLTQMNRIVVKDISSEMLRILQHICYIPPQRRNRKELARVFCKADSIDFSFQSHFEDVHTLIVKYEVNLIHYVAKDVYQHTVTFVYLF